MNRISGSHVRRDAGGSRVQGVTRLEPLLPSTHGEPDPDRAGRDPHRATPAAQPLQGRARDRGARGRPRARGRHPVVARRRSSRSPRLPSTPRGAGSTRARTCASSRGPPPSRSSSSCSSPCSPGSSSCSPSLRSCCSPRSRSRRSFSTGADAATRLSRLPVGVDCRPCSGAWPSGKATGFGPVIPGSNPGAPATVHRDADETRRSRDGRRARDAYALRAPEAPAPDPRAAHGRLGRRGSSPARPGTARRRRLPGNRLRVRRRGRRRAGTAARNRRRGPRGPRGARGRRRGPRPLGGHAAPHARRSWRGCSTPTEAAGPTRPCSPSCPDDVRSYGRIVRDADGALVSIVEASDATPAQLAIREANSSIYVFRASALWPAIDALTPANAQGELYLTDAVRGIVEGGGAVGVHARRRSRGGRGRQHEGRARRRDSGAPGPDQRRPHARGGHDRRPRLDLDRADGGPRGRLRRASLHRPARRDDGGRRRLRRAPRRGHRRGDRSGLARRDRSVTFAPAPCSRIRRRQARSWSSRTPLSGRAPRCRTCRTWATPTSARGTNVGAGSITANLSHHPERGKSRTRIGRDVKVAVDTMFVAPVTLGDDAWTAPGTVVTDDVPANALVGFAPRQEVKEGRGGNRDD